MTASTLTDPGHIDAYDFELPEAQIAHTPPVERGTSRLLVVGEPLQIVPFGQVAEQLRKGDLLVLNDTRVMPCRLFGHKASGGRAEIFVLGPAGGARWDSPTDGEGVMVEVLLRASRTPKPGAVLSLDGIDGRVRVDAARPDGTFAARLRGTGTLAEVLERAGRMPLPPYIVKRRQTLGLDAAAVEDPERYQTVYARAPGAVAAPTAGLHFSDALLDGLRAAGVDVGFTTLHVGMGTFKPLGEGALESQRLHSEHYTISAVLAAQVEAAVARGGRIVAVGTTSLRALEDQGRRHGARRVEAGAFDTDLFIRPGYPFQTVDALITNFHLPKSSLLVLVAAFAGYATMRRAYAFAMAEGMRFYSYGDAMWLSREAP